MNIHESLVQVEEVVAVLTPEAGVSVYQALQDAKLEGFESIVVDREKNQATVTWFKRKG
jgi:hypothetical protein